MKIRVLLSLLSLASLSFPLIVTPTGIAQNSRALEPLLKSSAEARVPSDFGRVPLSFEVNQGQSDSSVKFLSHGNGYSLFLTDQTAVLALSKREGAKPSVGWAVEGDVIRMELAGSRPDVRVSGADELPGKANYLIGNDPAKWHAGVPTYARVKYSGVYPGVDLVYYGNQRQLEYDFVVAPHADAKPLRLHFAGAQHLSLTSSGDLTVKGKNGEIAFHKPVVYQLRDGLREPVPGRFQLLARNDVRFTLDGYDHTRELVIDPALAYSTYLGGSGSDAGIAIAVDAAGDAYVAGATSSTDFPVTSGAFQQTNGSTPPGRVGFITKFNPKGSALIYSTYLGGTSGADGITNLAIDADGNAYVTGGTPSVDFPVTAGAFQKIKNGTSGVINAFMAKLNSTGSVLVYSTYLGGSGGPIGVVGPAYGDVPVGIAVDSAGNAYVAGSATSTDFPLTANAYQTTNKANGFLGGFNLFISKLNPAGSALVYSTYLGGYGINYGWGDTAAAIAIDSAGNAYVTGNAYSRDFPVTPNAFQTINNALEVAKYEMGDSTPFVSKLNPTGSALVYSTYLGGTISDFTNSIAVDPAGNAYVTGYALSRDFPVTPGAFQTVNKSPYDSTTCTNLGTSLLCGFTGFITKLKSTGSALVYSTFLGGSGDDSASHIALDAFGSAYITGGAGSTNFPVTTDAFRKTSHSPTGGNAFFSKLDSTGSALLYSSYLGGEGVLFPGGIVASGDSGNGIAVDYFGNAYITGRTCSADFPLAGAPFQATIKSGTGCTAFASKYIVNTVTGTTLTSDGNPQKQGVPVTLTAHVTPNTGTTIPTGSVAFSIDGTSQTTLPLDDTGHASFSTSSLIAGRYDITAVYSGSLTVSASSASLGQTIIGLPARIAVSSGANQSTAEGTPFAVRLVAQVQDERGVPVPAVLVTFNGAGLTFAGNPATTDTYGQASVIVTPITTGSLTATASVNGVSTPATFKLTATQPGP